MEDGQQPRQAPQGTATPASAPLDRKDALAPRSHAEKSPAARLFGGIGASTLVGGLRCILQILLAGIHAVNGIETLGRVNENKLPGGLNSLRKSPSNCR